MPSSRKGGVLEDRGLRNPNLSNPPFPATQDARAAGTFY